MKRVFIIFICLSCVLVSSCDDLLDRAPETSRTEASTFNDPNDFMLAVNYFYQWLPTLFTEQVGIIQRDLDADIACLASSRMSAISSSSYGTSPTDSRYSNYFSRVRAINNVFANEYKIEDKTKINKYLAEAYFFRAYYSFMMFQDYGPLTIVKAVMDTDSPELYMPRSSRDDFANFIIGDLETAISLKALPRQVEISGTAMDGRVTEGAAYALLARVCLFEASWQKYHEKNIARANELFEKSVYAARQVMSDKESYELFMIPEMGAESYRYMFVLENQAQTNPWKITKSSNKEYIFRKCFSEDTEGDYKYTSGANTVGTISASRKMAEYHLTKDGEIEPLDYMTSYESFLENRDPRMSMNFIAPNSYRWNYSSGRVDWTGGEADQANLKLSAAKDLGFPNNKWVTERTMDPDSWGIDIPIIRLAEVYLTFAEATYELNGKIDDTELNESINLIRERVGMVPLLNSSVPSGSDMLTEIRRERAVELYLEGFRLNDLRRWATAEKEMSQSFEYLYVGEGSAFLNPRTDNGSNQGMPPAEVVSDDGYAIKEEASKRLFQPKHYLMPLPTDQIKLNPEIKQNPYW